MAGAPFYVQASTGATDSAGTFTFTGVATGTVGDIVILQIFNDGTGVINWGTLTNSNINKLDGTAGWTEIGIFFAGAAAQQRLFIGRRTSASSAPTFTASANTSGDDVYGRMWEFTNVAAGTTLATVIENSTAGGTSTAGATASASVADAAVTTLGPDRLALNFTGINDDNAQSEFSGQTGGKWFELEGEYADSGGTDASIGVQLGAIFDIGGLNLGSTRNTGTTTWEQRAQSFVATGNMQGVWVNLSKAGAPADNFLVEIQTDNAGVPSGSVVASADAIAGTTLLTTLAGLSPRYIPLAATLTATQTYWVVFRRSGSLDNTNNYVLYGAANIVTGSSSYYVTGAWTAADAVNDIGIGVVTSTTGGTIDGGTFTQVDGTDTWCTVGFALIGTTPAGPAMRAPRNPAVNFQDPAYV